MLMDGCDTPEQNLQIISAVPRTGFRMLSSQVILEAQALWQQAYETKVDAHFQLYLCYVKYLKAVGRL